jgi:hypothetical protein
MGIHDNDQTNQPSTSRMNVNVETHGGTHFGPLKQHFGGCQFHNNEKVKATHCRWFQMQKPDL